jgi:asparagine synthase (glutamine-hydrolysing)
MRSLVAACLRQGGTRARKLSDFLAHARDPHELAALNRRVFPESGRLAILSPDVAESLAGISPFHPGLEAMRADVGAGDLFSLVSAWEMRTYMADVLLRDSDVMSMRHSIELRVPFVDRPLVEWLWRQPSRFKFDRRNPKSALAEAAADVLPPGLMNRRKRGFTLPFAIWMRKDLRPFIEDTLSPSSIGRSGLFSAGPARALWSSFLSGGDDRAWSRVWSLVVLVAFANRGRPDSPAAGQPQR